MNKNRPLKLVFNNEAIKRQVFSIAIEKGLAVSNDRTKKERENYNTLKEDLNKRITKGEKDLIIRGGKIVKRFRSQ